VDRPFWNCDDSGADPAGRPALAETAGIARLGTVSLTYLTVACRFRGQVAGVLRRTLRAQEEAEAAQMPACMGVVRANQAWVAWRRGDAAAAERQARDALALWKESPLVYAYQSLALWPLVGVALARGRDAGARGYVRALLDPKQQRLPDALNTPLEAAL
jgi:hypothetical protein